MITLLGNLRHRLDVSLFHRFHLKTDIIYLVNDCTCNENLQQLFLKVEIGKRIRKVYV